MSRCNFISYVMDCRGQDSLTLDAKEAFLPDVRSLLDKHDLRYHPHGFTPGQKCRYREALRQLSEEDSFDPAQVSETAQQKLDQSEDTESKVESTKAPDPDPVKEWLPKMKDEIFAKVGSIMKGASVKEETSGIGYVIGPTVKNDDSLVDQIQAVVDAARAEYGLSNDGIRLAHYEQGSPYAGKKPRIVFPYYKHGEAQKEFGIEGQQ